MSDVSLRLSPMTLIFTMSVETATKPFYRVVAVRLMNYDAITNEEGDDSNLPLKATVSLVESPHMSFMFCDSNSWLQRVN